MLEKKYKYAIIKNRRVILSNSTSRFHPIGFFCFDRLIVDPKITEKDFWIRIEGRERIYELTLFDGLVCNGIRPIEIEISNYVLEKE